MDSRDFYESAKPKMAHRAAVVCTPNPRDRQRYHASTDPKPLYCPTSNEYWREHNCQCCGDKTQEQCADAASKEAEAKQ